MITVPMGRRKHGWDGAQVVTLFPRWYRVRLCRHCGESVISRPRGLCWGCYYRPGVRERYAPINPRGHRGLGVDLMRGRPSLTPTDHLPGTEGKLLVMMQRALRGEELFHPDDAR